MPALRKVQLVQRARAALDTILDSSPVKCHSPFTPTVQLPKIQLGLSWTFAMKKKKRTKKVYPPDVLMKDFLELEFPRKPKQKKLLLVNGEFWEVTAEGEWTVPEFQ
jgi:hypothetical protein